MIETDLKIKDQFTGHRHVGYVHSDITIEEKPQPYTYEVKHDHIEDTEGLANFYKITDRLINDKLPTLENPPPPPPMRDLTEGKRPNHLSDIPEEMWNENYKPELPPSFIDKYFNSESLHHAIILGSIVFGLKMIELNWSVIKMFCIENQNYFYLAWALFAVLHINRDIYTSQKKKQENDQIDPNKLPDRKPHLEC